MNERHPLLSEELQSIAALDLPYERFDGRTVAITGAGGLVGSYLMRALDAVRRARGLKLNLIALCRNPERARAQLKGVENLTCLEYDATCPLTADFRADYILHAAANAHPLAFSTDPVGTMQANILGTMNLLEHIRKTGGRFILFSTGEIYGERPDFYFLFSIRRDENDNSSSFSLINFAPLNQSSPWPGAGIKSGLGWNLPWRSLNHSAREHGQDPGVLLL